MSTKLEVSKGFLAHCVYAANKWLQKKCGPGISNKSRGPVPGERERARAAVAVITRSEDIAYLQSDLFNCLDLTREFTADEMKGKKMAARSPPPKYDEFVEGVVAGGVHNTLADEEGDD